MNRSFSNYLILIASNSPVKFSKIFFAGVKFRAVEVEVVFEFEYYRHSSVSLCESLEIRLFFSKLSSRTRKRKKIVTCIKKILPKYSNDQRIKID